MHMFAHGVGTFQSSVWLGLNEKSCQTVDSNIRTEETGSSRTGLRGGERHGRRA